MVAANSAYSAPYYMVHFVPLERYVREIVSHTRHSCWQPPFLPLVVATPAILDNTMAFGCQIRQQTQVDVPA